MYNLHQTEFQHHRDGWKMAKDKLFIFHDSNSIVHLYDWADWQFREKKEIKEKWIGFLHNSLTYPKNDLAHKYQKKVGLIPISKLVHEKYFLNSLENCFGIFTMCKNTASFLKRHTDVLVDFVWHPTKLEIDGFDWGLFKANPKVVMIGQWLRRYQSIVELHSCYEKSLLITKNYEIDYNGIDVELINYLSNEEYDQMLKQSVVFLDLYDVAACNTILECIARNTPILVNILPGTIEYLGKEYPLFFESLEEASDKLKNDSLLIEAHEYLKNMKKDHLQPDSFLNQFLSSKIITNMPMIKLI